MFVVSTSGPLSRTPKYIRFYQKVCFSLTSGIIPCRCLLIGGRGIGRDFFYLMQYAAYGDILLFCEVYDMKMLMNFPLYDTCLSEYGSAAGLSRACAELGCDGVEAIWGDTDYNGPSLKDVTVGYHMTFWPDWLDFWNGDREALLRKFGSEPEWIKLYRGRSRDDMLAAYRQDLRRALDLGAEYLVFHVSDVSIEEGFTYKWLHSDEDVIDASCELINALTDGMRETPAVLVENQWWPGFTFTDPRLTERLLNGIDTENKGIMLDTGHLLSTDQSLEDEKQAVAYINRMLDLHGELSKCIRGLHLHKSLSGEYVKQHTGRLPEDMPEDYEARFIYSYPHILKIDRHEPWTEPAIAETVGRIAPEWVNHELAGFGRAVHENAVRTQMDTLRAGGLSC